MRLAMRVARYVCLSVVMFAACNLLAETCPKVAYSTPNATIKNLVAAVNCMNRSEKSTEMAADDKAPKPALSVETFPIIGPQHTRNYRHVVFAVLSVPVGNGIKSVAVTKESEPASIMSTGGGACQIKVNPDNTVDGQCSMTGGTMYVAYRN
jgi:hypothetical protein